MIASLLLLATAPHLLNLDLTGFGDDALVYVSPKDVASSSTLIWQDGARLRLEQHVDELVVHFDRMIDEASIADFEAEAGSYVQTLRWNDDSLLLRPNPGIQIQPDITGNRLVVSFLVADHDAHSEPATPANAERDLAIVSIRADIASGFMGSARRKAEQLAIARPDDRYVRRLLADAQAADGDHRSAAKSYMQAGARDRAAMRTVALAPGQASLWGTIRGGSGFAQGETGARATVSTGDRTMLGVSLRYLVTRADDAMLKRRIVSDIETDATLADITVTMRPAPRLAIDLTGSAWLDTGVVGGGARLVYGSSDTQMRVGYGRGIPDLSFAEQALDNGTVSQLSIGGSAQILPELRSRVDLGWRQYGLRLVDDAAESLTVAGQIDYIVSRRPIVLSLGYRIDAEYVQSVALVPSGRAYLPLGNRENHTVQAFASGAAGPVLLTGGAGWTIDRYGGSGPNVSLAAGVPLGLLWQLDAGVGMTSISRPGYPARQTFGRIELRRGLGSGR